MGRALRRRGDSGGISALAEVIADHGGALDYDLMTMTRYTLRDVGERLPVATLSHFVAHLPPESATMRALHPQDSERLSWMRGDANAQLLVRLIEEVRALEWAYVSAHSKSRPPKPKPVPTPWTEDTVEQHIGKDAILIANFDAWWDAKEDESNGN